MNENKSFLIDSNILIYSIDSSEKDKYRKAKELLKLCWIGKAKYAVSIQNLSEFFINATNKIEKPIEKEEGMNIVRKIIEFENFIKIMPRENTIINAMEINSKENIPYWDALIIATMKENNIFNIYTENVKDFRIAGINAINPFE